MKKYQYAFADYNKALEYYNTLSKNRVQFSVSAPVAYPDDEVWVVEVTEWSLD